MIESDRYLTTTEPTEPKKLSEQLVDMFREAGRDPSIVKFEGTKVFKGAIVFSQTKMDDEPTIRIYRGAKQLDRSLLHQEPYALRTRPDRNKKDIQFLDHARDVMEALAAHPTAQRLYDYVDTIWPDLTDEEIERFDKDLRDVEDGVTNMHLTLRWSLMSQQYHYNSVSWPDTGIPPYLPATLDPKQAIDYGRDGGVLIVDIPLSKVDFVGTHGEVSIQGALKQKYITAILPCEPSRRSDEDLSDFEKARMQLDAVLPPAHDQNTETTLIQAKNERTRKEDEAQWEQDAKIIRERRTRNVLRKFAETGVVQSDVDQLATDMKIDSYTAAKQAIYDAYLTRAEKIGKRRDYLEGLYYEGTYGDRISYDREHADDGMLSALKKQVERLEKIYADRESSRHKRIQE